MNKLLVILIALLSSLNIAYAQGNINAGKAKSKLCSTCHGVDGNSTSSLYPKLAGQDATYLVRQSQAFKSGTRANLIMSAMASRLSEQDMQDITAYYASQTMKQKNATIIKNTMSGDLYMNGDQQRQVIGCERCHGPQGNGLALAGAPKIAGQHGAYLASQLINFRSALRNHLPKTLASDLSEQLTDSEIEQLSGYISTLY